MPAASSLTRASRSISDERSMPIAWRARGPNSSIIRPVPVPMSTSRPSSFSSSARSIACSTDAGSGTARHASSSAEATALSARAG